MSTLKRLKSRKLAILLLLKLITSKYSLKCNKIGVFGKQQIGLSGKGGRSQGERLNFATFANVTPYI